MSSRTSHTFWSMLALYACTLAVGIWAAWRHVTSPASGTVAPLQFDLSTVLIFGVVFVFFTFVVLRWARVAQVVLSALFLVVFAGGAQFILSARFSLVGSTIGALALVACALLVRRVLVHDVVIVLGIAGITALLGLALTPLVVVGILMALSVYDIISVYRTRHMVAMAGRMVDSGFFFGFLIPSRVRDFWLPTRTALGGHQVMLLGSGDIGLPLVLAASSVSVSLGTSILVAAFALVGVALMEFLFTHQREPMPMAALPPIAALSVIGYLVAVLIHL